MKIAKLAHPEDIIPLPDDMRRRVVKTLVEIAADPERGKVLSSAKGHQHFEADLGGLRSCPLGEARDYEAEVRIVYRYSIQDGIEVLAIGPRMGSQCYKLAAERLAKEAEPKPKVHRRHAR